MTSDWQVGAGAKYGRAAHGPHSRLADQERVLNAIADLARERNIDLVLHCGDVLHTRTPSVAEILTAKHALEAMPCPVLVVAGNHDRSGTGPASPEIFERDGIRVSLTPETIDYPDCTVATLPWSPPGHFIAKAGRDGDVNAEISAALVDVCADLRRECQLALPAVLVLHWWVEGATTAHGAGEGVIHEPVIPWAPLEEQGWSLIVAGHVHKPQLLGGEGSRVPGFYCGPPSVTDFGEADQEHGVWIVDTTDPWAAEFVALPDRPFVNLVFSHDDVVAQLALTDSIGWEIPEGAVVRLRYRATEEQHRRIDQAAIRTALEEAGASRVFVEPQIVRADQRRRIEGVDETMGPGQALAAWCIANDLDDEQINALAEYTAGLLEQVAA